MVRPLAGDLGILAKALGPVAGRICCSLARSRNSLDPAFGVAGRPFFFLSVPILFSSSLLQTCAYPPPRRRGLNLLPKAAAM
jgi:hypothetical protein